MIKIPIKTEPSIIKEEGEIVYACPDCNTDCFGKEQDTEYDEYSIVQFYKCDCGTEFSIVWTFESKERKEKS